MCGGYRVDLLIPKPTGIGDDAKLAVAAGGIAVEVDGPSHFARNDQAQAMGQGLTLVHFSAQLEPLLSQNTP